MSIFNYLVRIRGLEIMLCIASMFFMALLCETPDNDKSEPPTSGVTALAGGGPGFEDATGTAARFDTPLGIVLDFRKSTSMLPIATASA